MRDSTLIFLIQKQENKISKILLAMKKRGFGKGKWNGVGGKVEDETILQAAIRETKEEIDVIASDLKKVAELEFDFLHEPDWGQKVHVFITETWEGDPKESEEMMPQWYEVENIPYNEMWPDDEHWFPHMFEENLITGTFKFKENDEIVEHFIELVEKF